ncbi:mitogen-activated protein kinase kinase kinase 7-like [Drosophila sulfurigaster albostrigata]|uniref:mitogen-activated protein kinase kinase kinase 7-like n=1 Tax=Drosophila sulfurigaster albostrigata TaxID=89887 RepID=UPI002D219188|nr:mitogen-activated protein kinase kinase kinase 7-like [Drosophila sulfurigaster albostrigata]
MEISYADITCLEMIDGGTFGDVFEAIWNSKGLKIAVKKIRIPSEEEEEMKVQREIQNLKDLEHTNIVKLYGFSKDPENKICIVLEYAECGSLYKYLHQTQYHIPNDLKIDWMLQCAEGMEYLHEEKTFHRDLKTKNLLLFNQYRTLKICDFGTVKEITTINTELTGTCGYMAPEVCENNGKYTEKCDVFSFGIVLWEVLARKKPFYNYENINELALLNKVCKGARPKISDIEEHEDTDNLKPIFKMCWQHEPERRLTMKKVVCIIKNHKKNMLYRV